jgi:predicted nucleic acid-binding Zn ribbon protein
VYKFVDTGETIEVQQGFHDENLTEVAHPDSGELMPVKKVFTPVGVTFKGSGFFKTDNRGKKSASSPASSDSGSSSDSTSKSDSSSSDSKSTSAPDSTSGSKSDSLKNDPKKSDSKKSGSTTSTTSTNSTG